MKKMVLVSIILFSSVFAEAAISDRYCNIGVAPIGNILVSYTVYDSDLQVLINKGYRPYRVESADQVTSGLRLKWGWYSRKTIFGNYKKVYEASVVQKENGREMLLGTGSGGSLSGVLRGLPDCRLK